MFRSIGFIGGRRVTRILLGGWNLGHALPEVVRVSAPGADSLEKLRRLLPGVERFAGDNAPPASCDLAFLALHPLAIPGVLGETRSHIRPDAILPYVRRRGEDLAGIGAPPGGGHRPDPGKTAGGR